VWGTPLTAAFRFHRVVAVRASQATIALSLLLLLAHPTIARAAPPASLSCPEPQFLKLDLPRWKGEVEQSRDLAALMAVLKRAELPSGPSPPLEFEAEEKLADPPVVDWFHDVLGPASGGHHQILQVRFMTKDSQLVGQQIAWVQILEPLSTGGWCALGAEMTSTISRHDSESCTKKPGTVFQLVPLIDPNFKAIRTTRRTGSCYGSDRGEATYVSYWAVVSHRLVRVLDGLVPEAHTYMSAEPDRNTETKGTITLKGGFPKEIEYRVTTKSSDPDRGDKPTVEVKVVNYQFDGSKYVEKPRPGLGNRDGQRARAGKPAR
jgi:hypothetical protein